MLSSAAEVPQTMLSPSAAVPQTMVPSAVVPQTMLSSAIAVPHTMLSPSAAVPHTMLSTASKVPQTMLSPSAAVPQTMVSQVSPHAVPQTMLSPSAALVFAPPHSTPRRQALAAGSMRPPVSMWVPQSRCLLQVDGIGTTPAVPAGRPASDASAAACDTFRKPAPCRSALIPGLDVAVYSRMALMRFGVSAGFASSMSATVPLTNGAAMLVPVRLSYGGNGVASGTVPGISHDGVARRPS